MSGRGRSAVFARSDIQNAAEEFIQAVAEHADTIWMPDDIAELAESLTDKAFEVLRNQEAKFDLPTGALVFTGPDVATVREVLGLYLAETKWTTVYPELTPEEREAYPRRRAVCEKAMATP